MDPNQATDEHGARVVEDQLGEFREFFDRSPGLAPSYSRGLAEIRLESDLMGRLGSPHVYWRVNPKHAGAAFASSHGVPVPAQYASALSIDELDFASLPESFVLKPANGSTNRGVFALRRRLDGSFVELLSQRTVMEEDVVTGYHDLRMASQVSANVVVEELLTKPGNSDAVPDDIKVFCFYDRAPLVMQRDMRGKTDAAGWRFKLWTPDWREIGPVNWIQGYDGSLVAPVSGNAIVSSALTLSMALRLPALRVDFFDTTRGPVFGEFTMTPGLPAPFTPLVDRALGAHLALARAALAASSSD